MVEIDAVGKSSREINELIKAAVMETDMVRVINPAAKHHLGVGLLNSAKIVYEGSVGYFCTALTDGIDVEINGNAGWCLGDNMMKSTIVVNGAGGSSVGPALCGGTIIVHGNVGNRMGQVMKDGLIVVAGNAGYMAGFMMMGGKIIVLGDIGDQAGHWMINGEIYVGGQVKSLGVDAKVQEISEKEQQFLNNTLIKYGLQSNLSFVKIVSAQKLHHYEKKEY